MDKKKKTRLGSFAQRLTSRRKEHSMQTSASESNMQVLRASDISLVIKPPKELTLVITRNYSSDQQVSDNDGVFPDNETASLPVTPVNSRHEISRTQSWKEPAIWGQSPDTKTKQRRTSAGLMQKLGKQLSFETDLCMMRKDCLYWVFMREGIDVDTDFEVKRVANYETYVDELLAEGATIVSAAEHSHLMKEIHKIRQMVNPDPSPDEMTRLQREPPPEGFSDWSDDRSLNHVQQMFPNDDLQLYADESLTTPRCGTIGRRKSAPGALILRRSKQRSFSGSGLPSPTDGSTDSRRSSSCSASRMYILEGPVQLTNSAQAQDRYLFLFSDLLLVAKQKSSNVFRLKQRVHVCDMWTASCMDDVAETTRTPDKSFVMGWPTVNVVATFRSSERKSEWLTELQEQISREKEKEETKSVVIRIMNKEGDRNVVHDLEVANHADARDVVKQCVDLFGITDGSYADYKLWVRSAKDDSFYPLIGHELPFSIQMSKIREAHLRSDSEILPNHLDGSDTSLLCQFILRDMRKTPKKMSIEDGQRNLLKRKKSPLLSFIRKKLHDLSPVQPPDSGLDILPQFPEEGRLFGRPLVEICNNRGAPKAIMELLQYLIAHGPGTIGIFRKCANQKTVREVREQLDSGSPIALEDVSVLVVATIVKDFLRSTPDCVFLCSLYHKWIATMSCDDDKDKILVIKQLLTQLPSAHHHLLTCVMFLLHRIADNSDENCMTSFNLAVCIGQSLLWQQTGDATTTTSDDPTGHADARENVPRFVEFLIENCLEIFGFPPGDVGAEDGGDVRRRCQSTVTESSTDSDSMHSMLTSHERPCHLSLNRHNDSSLDSLERDLYGMEGETSPQMMQKHLSPTNLSRDSGLTNSDTQLYSEDALESENTILTRTSAAQRIPTSGFRHSLSQVEGSAMVVSDHSDSLSKSFDSALLMTPSPMPPKVKRKSPVPPKRKSPVPPKRKPRGTGTVSQSTSPTTSSSEDKTALPKLLPLKHSDSTPVVPSPVRVSFDVADLGKTVNCEVGAKAIRRLDDYSDLSCDDFHALHGVHRDMGELRRSESGANMYIDGQLIHHSFEPMSEVKAQKTKEKNISVAKEYSGHSDPIGKCSKRGSLPTNLRLLPISHSFSDFQTLLNSDARTNKAPTSMARIPDKANRCAPVSPAINEELKSVALVKSAVSSMSHTKQRRRHHDLSHPSYSVLSSSGRITKHGSLVHQERVMQSCDVAHIDDKAPLELAPPQVAAPTQGITRKCPLKGTTGKGSDVFPAASWHQIQRSFEECDIIAATPPPTRVDSQLRRACDSACSRNKLLLSNGDRTISNVCDDDNHKDAGIIMPPSPLRSASPSVQRSSSDLHVEQHMARQRQSLPVTLQRHRSDHKRSNTFPWHTSSDHETLNISEEEILEQTANSARAKRMYEESLQRYAAQVNTAPSKKVTSNGGGSNVTKTSSHVSQPQKKALPDYEEACVRAETLKEEAARNSCNSANSTEALNVHGGSDSRKDDLCRKQSRLSARRRQAERHRAQRLSDTRLAEINGMKNGGSLANILRSKSDSSEHFDSVLKFRHVAPPQSSSDEDVYNTNTPSLVVKDKPSLQSRRSEIRSMRSKRWHQEMAEQYSQPFYQCPEDEVMTQPKYSYADTSPQKEEGNNKRRWVPPVHPTKHLLINDLPLVVDTVRCQWGNFDNTLVSNRRTSASGATNSTLVSEAVLRGNSVECEPAIMSSNESETIETERTSASDIDTSPVMSSGRFSWSVSRLRNLYGGSTDKSVICNPLEQINPNAHAKYV